jgi:ribosomal peptide maturation radical SAM protein 1
MRVLLLQMPFFLLDTPSIGLALIKASLEVEGIQCDLRYLNLEFGKKIGNEVYSWISWVGPRKLLIGDLVFAPSLHDDAKDRSRIQDLMAFLSQPDFGVPTRMIELFPELVDKAEEFLADKLREIEWDRYGLVGFGTMFQIAPALALAKRIKSLDAAPPVILGGGSCEDEMGEHLHRRFPYIDYVCRGEGEGLIVDLTTHLANDASPPEHIPGLVWRDGEDTRCNGERAAGPVAARTASAYPLDSLPIPHYDDWMGQVDSSGLVAPELRRLPIQTSRGCWYGEKHHCVFCGLNGKTIAHRRKSPERALMEFRELKGYGVKMIHAVDDILDPRYFHNLLPQLGKDGSDCEIFFEVKANLTRRHVELLRDAGIRFLQPGIESLNSRLLALMNKGVTALQNVRLLKYVAELGVRVVWNLLYGFPGEDPQDYLEMADLIPALTHLQPPSHRPCNPVRIHRFSPLYVNRDDYKLAVEPVQAYYKIFPFDRETVTHLAYHFDHRYLSHPDPESYIEPCARAVRNWQAEVGRAAFLCFETVKALHLIDTRRVASQPTAKLHGLEREVFESCADGASMPQLVTKLERPAHEIGTVLDTFLERRWSIELDQRYLSLAVPVAVPPYVPPALVADGLRKAYCEQMAQLHHAALPTL